MLRRFFLFLSERRGLYNFIRRNRIANLFARRFVPGEDLESALGAVRELNSKKISATLDLLGESVTNEAEARATGREYLRMLDAIAGGQLDCNVSVKLTALGLDISEELCEEVVVEILEKAKAMGNFVRLDMEGSAYTQRTLTFFEERLYPRFPENVGIVLQSYLKRTAQDVERAVELQCRVRLCKGAYKEPPTVAFPERARVDQNYVDCLKRLMQDGFYPGLATHDDAMITAARTFATEKNIGADRFEFQMLYGIRRDLQEQLVSQGYRMRVYIPFGTEWYPYLMRRLAERPANVVSILASVLKERRLPSA